jgi:hypothetical protein
MWRMKRGKEQKRKTLKESFDLVAKQLEMKEKTRGKVSLKTKIPENL